MPNIIRNRFEQFRNPQASLNYFNGNNKQEFVTQIPATTKIKETSIMSNILPINGNFNQTLTKNFNNGNFNQNFLQNTNFPLNNKNSLTYGQSRQNLTSIKNISPKYNPNPIILVNKALDRFETNIDRFAKGSQIGDPQRLVLNHLNSKHQQELSIDNYLQQQKKQQFIATEHIIDSSPKLWISPSASQAKTIILINKNLNREDQAKENNKNIGSYFF